MPIIHHDRLLRLGEFLTFTIQVIWTITLVLSSHFFSRPLGGHALKIGRISPFTLSLHDVTYSGALYNRDYAYTFTAPSLSIAFHIPTPSYPRWLTFSARDIFYVSSTCDVSLSTLDVTFWIFPYLSRRTAGPWTSVVLDGFRIRVHRSSATPYWIQRLRENLVGALLQGEILRLDDFLTKAHFAGFSEPFPPGQPKNRRQRASEEPLFADYPAPSTKGQGVSPGVQSGRLEDGSSDDIHSNDAEDEAYSAYEEDVSPSDEDTTQGEGESDPEDKEQNGLGPMSHRDAPPPFTNTNTDELRISASARQLHLNNTEGRIFTFGAIDAQLRRDWDEDRGSFVMVAEEARWVRVHWPYQRQPTPWWSQLLTSVVQFPLDLVHVLNYPMSTVNLYIPRADIMFDEFRIRDASLIIQSLTILRAKTASLGINWGDLFLDAVIQIFIRP